MWAAWGRCYSAKGLKGEWPCCCLLAVVAGLEKKMKSEGSMEAKMKEQGRTKSEEKE